MWSETKITITNTKTEIYFSRRLNGTRSFLGIKSDVHILKLQKLIFVNLTEEE